MDGLENLRARLLRAWTHHYEAVYRLAKAESALEAARAEYMAVNGELAALVEAVGALERRTPLLPLEEASEQRHLQADAR